MFNPIYLNNYESDCGFFSIDSIVRDQFMVDTSSEATPNKLEEPSLSFSDIKNISERISEKLVKMVENQLIEQR